MIPTIVSALKRHRLLIALILIALLLRAAFVLLLDPHPNLSGGDANWYMYNGRRLVLTGKTPGPLQTAPLYPVFVGGLQVLTPGWHGSGEYFRYTDMQSIRLVQSTLGAALCGFVFLLGRRLISARAGWIAAALVAFSPALIIEAGKIASEGLFMFFMFGALALYARFHDRATPGRMALAGAAFGLATLTRAVFLAFPLGLVLHLWLTHRAQWVRLTATLLVAYGAVVATWTVYNLIVWDRLVIGGEGLLAFVHQGAEGKAGPSEYDAGLGLNAGDTDSDRLNKIKKGVKDNILGDPAGWAFHRAKELGRAYLQPHNTNYYPGESIRYAAQDWLRDDRTLDGLIDLTRIESFWEKLAVYVFHFGTLAAGLAGMAAFRKRWRALLPVYGVILYFTGVHLILLALPRYLFPTYPAYALFAGGFAANIWNRLASPAQNTIAAQSSLSGGSTS